MNGQLIIDLGHYSLFFLFSFARLFLSLAVTLLSRADDN
jgi:hypothetical protein